MWRIAVRMLVDTNNIASSSSSRVLKRCAISSQHEVHPSIPRPKEPSLLRKSTSFVQEQKLPVASRCHLEFRSPSAEFQLGCLQSHLSDTDIKFLRHRFFSSGNFCKHLPTRTFIVSSYCFAQSCRSLASRFSLTCKDCRLTRSCELHNSVSYLRARLHSAALALSFDENSTQEAALFSLHGNDCHSSQPRITDVHGTLNTVLWGIPMIANQMSSKPAESQAVLENHTLSMPALTELEFVRLSQFSDASILEAPVVSNLYSQLNFLPLEECVEAVTVPAFPSEQSSAKEVVSPRKDSQRRYQQLRRRQLRLETHAWQCAIDDYKNQLADMCKNQLAPKIPLMKSLLLSWFEPLTAAISAEQATYRSDDITTAKGAHGPYLCLLPADKLAVITMHKTVAKLLSEDGHGCLRVIVPVMSIGEAVEEEVRLNHFMEKRYKRKEAGKPGIADDEHTKQQKLLQKKVQKVVKQGNRRLLRKKLKEIDHSEPWGSVVRAQVGSRLLELLLQTAYIQDPECHASDGSVEIRPAFRHSLKSICQTEGGVRKGFAKAVGVIECDSFISKSFQNMARVVVIPYMPMLVRPCPWQGYRKGGHLVLPACIMRTHGAKELTETLKKTPNRQLKTIFDALDILGATKWRINKKVLEVVEKIWEDGGHLANIVDRADVPEPQKPETDDADALKTWRWKVRKVKRTNQELHGQRCDMELKLSVAQQMKEEDYFYYPHNIDFRGRAYPLHPHLNHLGSDLCRGLLEFAEGCPLRSKGLWWLKIQLANVYGQGYDKLSFHDRIAFADRNLDSIFDSAKKPLEGHRWWLSAEDPFQCLATCIEISNALASPDLETYISHLPVHQDGSCNGLQHYAALGRDCSGAESVNLTAQQKPADVYTGIAKQVKGLLEKDFQNKNLSEQARQLHLQVDRKLVKQTVMTSVYGVTYVGARGQIMKRLQERSTIPDEDAFKLSCYAAKTTLNALGELFSSARVIMSWLGDCAKIIASKNQALKWTTPLGLPVVQPYRNPRSILVRTSLQTLQLKDCNDTKVMVRRQKAAFPPNFVHSLDSTHMMMTAIACSKAGLTFAGVHDSYWTHAGDVETMNIILREKFVELYDQPILENLLKGFEENFPGLQFPPVPARGDFKLKEVLQSPYFFN